VANRRSKSSCKNPGLSPVVLSKERKHISSTKVINLNLNIRRMKGIDDLLLLGNPLLYQVAEPVLESELKLVAAWVADLDNVMKQIRQRYNFGRGIAAPQLGIMKRLIYIKIDKPLVIINPELRNLSLEMFELWDDCMCFPNLLVR